MNFPQNSVDLEHRLNSKLFSTKDSMTQDFYKSIPSNQITINFCKESNSLDARNNKTKKINQKKYITTIKKEVKEDEKEEEEEEINSDEYVSSTMLDVDTNTYINMTNNTKNEEGNINSNNNNNINIINSNYSQGKLKNKENNKDLDMYLINKIQTITDEKDLNENVSNNTKNYKKEKNYENDNNVNNENDGTINTIDHHQSQNKNKKHKKDLYNNNSHNNNNKNNSISKEKRNNSISIDKKAIFTPKIESKSKLKILRDMIIEKLDHYHNKNPYFVNQSNTINIIENIDDNKNNEKENDNNMKSINNEMIIKKNINLNIENNNKHKRNKTSRITHNNSISIISNKSNKNIQIQNNNQQHIQNNNNININIYNKNIIKDIRAINIDDQKYQLIPQTIKKVKTQGRVGKIVYTNQNKKNNFIYINNYSTNTNNKTTNSPLNKKINRVSPPQNSINNIEFYNSICANKKQKNDEHHFLKHSNIHSLKNLKSENLQKNIKKYLLGEEYFTIFPLQNGKNNLEKQKVKIVKDSKNKKFVKKKNNKTNNNEDVKFKANDIKIKKIIPLNINNIHCKQLRSVNSCCAKKGNKYNYNNEPILNTISNNNKKIDIYNNFKNNYNNFTQNKSNYASNKRIFDEKMKKNKELSFNSAQENNSIKNILSLKNSKYLRNKCSLQNSDLNYDINNNNNNMRESNSNYQIKKTKPVTTRIQLNSMTEGNKNLIKNNLKNNINSNTNNNNNNEDNIKTKSNKNSSAKRIIYIDNNNNNLKNFSTRQFIFNSLSPNCQSIKQLMNKGKITNIKEIYNNINNNQGRNTYNTSHIHNNSNNFQNNSNINYNINNNKIFIKNIQKEALKNLRSMRSNDATRSMNYNMENISQYSNSNLSPNHRKIIPLNNISCNCNINHTLNNTNIANIKERPNNIIYKNTIEILSPFSSINNRKFGNISHKKIYINKHNNEQINSSNNKNIIFLDGSKMKNNHTFNGTNISNTNNKYLYNKNMIYKLNCNDNFNNFHINNSQLNYNIRINNIPNNNNFIHFSNSNDKERNTITNKSYGNIYLNRNRKDKSSKEKNITLEIFEKNLKNVVKKKIMSPVQALNK